MNKPVARVPVELLAAVSTYLTMSYIFLLNPVLLRQAGVDASLAFFATVVSAAAATLLMGLWAKLPFAVASAPSITTFLVSFICLELGLDWQVAMLAILVSGVLSILMTTLSFRQRFIESMPAGLKIALLFAVCGFLVANGLRQAKLISHPNGFVAFAALDMLVSGPALALYAGLAIALLFRALGWLGGPLVGIMVAALVAAAFGIRSKGGGGFSWQMLSGPAQLLDISWRSLLDWRVPFAIFVFFVIDFFGGVGKFVGLFTALGRESGEEGPAVKRALYVDGIGTVVGGALGGSSLAVFVSSAVGVAEGGRTGLTAIFIAALMLASFLFFPLIGAIPVEATAGILVYVGLLLLPLKEIRRFGRMDIIASVIVAIVAFVTFGLDDAMLVAFAIYTVDTFRRKDGSRAARRTLLAMALLLGAAVVAAYIGR
jgi:adenine/guanine/hypoxanthine permease